MIYNQNKLLQLANFVFFLFILTNYITAQESKLNINDNLEQFNEYYTLEERHRLGIKNTKVLAQIYEERVYVSSSKEILLYRLLIPIDYNPKKKYPLVICLSGSSGRGNDNIRQIAGSWSAQFLAKQENREKHPAFVFVPQCPENSNWGLTIPKNRGTYPSQLDVESMVFEAIASLEKEFKIDTTRRYLAGQSLGAFGVWYYIIKRPQMFAAAIPICGGGDPFFAEKIVDIPVWAFHGKEDTAVPVEYSRDMINSIRKLGGKPRYTEFPDVGHISWPIAFDTPGLLDWLFNQIKE